MGENQSRSKKNIRDDEGPVLTFVPADETEKILETHEAFREEFTKDEWEKKGDDFFDLALKDQDEDKLVKARQHYLNAESKVKVMKVDAKNDEWNGNWERAGKLYSEMAQELNSDEYREEAARSFKRGRFWGNAYAEYDKMSDNPQKKKNLAVCAFYRDRRQDPQGASGRFYDYAAKYRDLEREHLAELAALLTEQSESASKWKDEKKLTETLRQASEILEQIGERFDDKTEFSLAGEESYRAGDFNRAKELFERAKDTKRTEYELSIAELDLQANSLKAIEGFFHHRRYLRVTQAYEKMKGEKQFLRADLKMVADSYLAQRGENPDALQKAKAVYEQLTLAFTDGAEFSEALDCVPEEAFPSNSIERYEAFCRVLSAAAKSSAAFDSKTKDKLLDAVREVEDFVSRDDDDRVFPARLMGIVYDKVASPKARADFYRNFAQKVEWARKPYISALDDLHSDLVVAQETLKADSLRGQISELRKMWGLAGQAKRPVLKVEPRIVSASLRGQISFEVTITNTGDAVASNVHLEAETKGPKPLPMAEGGRLELQSLRPAESLVKRLTGDVPVSEVRGQLTFIVSVIYADPSGKELGPIVETRSIKQMLDELDEAGVRRLIEDYRRVVVETLRESGKPPHNAATQELFYEELVRDFARENIGPAHKTIKGEIRDEQSGSGDCDIIVYDGDPTYIARSGLVGVIPSGRARAIIEVEGKASVISDKYKKGVYERFKKFCPKVLVIAMTGGADSGRYRKQYDLDVFILANKRLQGYPTEFKRLIAALNAI